MTPDANPEGHAQSDIWNTNGTPEWQAALIRLARPALLWALGVVTMGLGTVLVGLIEAIWPGSGIRMASAMAALLRAYPVELYILVGVLFGGQAVSGVLQLLRGAKP